MATKQWLGIAKAVKQESRATPAVVETGDIFRIKVNGVTIAEFTATAATVANVTAGLTTAWNASTHPYKTTITATDRTTYVELLADEGGWPFTVTSQTVNGGAADTQTLTISTPTAATGPHHWDDVTNWSGGTIPVNTDTVVLKDSARSILYGLGQGAVTLVNFEIHKTFTGRIGLNEAKYATSADGLTEDPKAREYRTHYLAILWSGVLTIGLHNEDEINAQGSGRIKIDGGATANTIEVHATANASVDSGLPAVRLKMLNAATNLFVRSAPGGAGVACDVPGETSTLGDISVTAKDALTQVTIGSGTLFANWTQYNGNNVIKGAAGAITSVKVHDGKLRTEGDYTITTGTINSGEWISNHIRTAGACITTLYVNDGKMDFLKSRRARTVTTMNHNNGTVDADESVLTVTNHVRPTRPYSLKMTANPLGVAAS